jgi:tetratricopeptide (TPR) repeat protein
MAPVIGLLYTPSGSNPKDIELTEHKNMGRWVQAILIQHDIFQDRQKHLGPDHSSTLQAAYDLAHAYCQMQDPKHATPWIDWVLQASKSALGNDHQLTLKAESLSSEAMSLRGDHSRAEEVCARVSMRQEELLGRDHADTLDTQGRLGKICLELGRKDEGQARLRRWAEALERIHGENHMKAHQAGLIVCEQVFTLNLQPYMISQIPEATKTAVAQLHKDISDAHRRQHPLAIVCLRLLGSWQASEGNYVEALDTLRRALNDCEALGKDHPETVNIEGVIGALYYKQSMWKDAAPRFQRYSDWMSERGGESNQDNLNILSMLGQMYMIAQEWPKVKLVYEKLLAAAAGVDDQKVQEAEQALQQVKSLLQLTSFTSSFGSGRSQTNGLFGALGARYGLR